MEEQHEDEGEVSPACLVLPVNPVPLSISKAKHEDTKDMLLDIKSAKVLSEFPQSSECRRSSKQDILEADAAMTDDMAPDPTAVHQSQSDEISHSDDIAVDPVTQSWFTSRDSKDNLSKKGHKWKQGMWSKEEVDLLERNIEEYLKIRKLGDAVSVIFQMSKEERKDFYRFIAKGLQRPLFAVYRRVIRMYDSKNHVGRYSVEDIEKLKGLREKYGNEWCAIGAEMGRSAASVKDKVRLLKDRCHQGKWTISEETLLADAVYSLSKAAPGENITTGISWSQVSTKVYTRTEKQCRAKWLNYLNWKHSGGTEWTKEDDGILFERLSESGALCDSHVNWEELSRDWSSARSPQWLRSKWWMLKRNVAGHEGLDLPSVIAQLRASTSNSKHGRSRGHKMMPSRPTMAMTTLTVPMGATGDQVSVYQYEVLDTSMGLSPSNAYLIESSANQEALSTSADTDSFIVTTMQGDHIQDNDNVTVHLNRSMLPPTGQIIISTIPKNSLVSTSDSSTGAGRQYRALTPTVSVGIPDGDKMDSQSVHEEDNSIGQSQLMGSHEVRLATGISQSEQTSEDITINQSEMIRGHENQLTGDIGQSDQPGDSSLSSESQLIGTDAVLTQQDMVPEVSDETDTHLIRVSSSSLMQPVGSVDESQLTASVFSLSGQILQSRSVSPDLLESPTSMEPHDHHHHHHHHSDD